jgi:hypothetical protein
MGETAERGKGETAEILNAVFEKGAKIDPALVDLWKEATQQRDELAKQLAEKQPASAQAPQLDLLNILTQVRQPQGDPLAMLEKLKGFFPVKDHERSKEQPQQNSLDELKKVLDLFGQAQELFKPEPAPVAVAGPGPDAELWERIAVNLSGQIARTLNALAGVVLAFKSHSPAVPGAGGTPGAMATGAPVSFDPYRDQAAMRIFARSQSTAGPTSAPSSGHTATPPPPAAAAAPPPGPGDASASANDPITSQVITSVSQALNCLNRGVDGYECAQALIDLNGDLTYGALVQQIQGAGIPVVLELAKGIPEISLQVITYEQPLKEFMEQFLQGPEYAEMKSSNPPDAATSIDDTILVQVEPDGTPVYASKRETELAAIASGIVWIFDHPYETLLGLVFTSLAVGSLYLVYDAIHPPSRPVRRRRK